MQAGAFADGQPEFCRIPDVQTQTGLKPGCIYNLINNGIFESVLVRQPGNRFGIRLVHWPSVKRYLKKLLVEQRKNPIKAK